MIYGSVCSGIDAASVAWLPLGWRCAFLSEIEAFPRAVLQHHYPEVPLHGDFTTVKAGQYEPIDLLVGGTPCQDFSVAGLRVGLDGERGQLTLEFVNLAERLRPKWLVWENVPGVLSIDKGRAFGAFLGGLADLGYGFAYRVLDAQFFGVPQRRRRVFVVGYLGDWRRAASVLFERESLRRNTAPSRKEAKDVAGTIATGAIDSSNGGADDNDARAGRLIGCRTSGNCGAWETGDRVDALTTGTDPTSHVLAFGENNTAGPIDVATARNACSSPSGRLDFKTETFVVRHGVRRLTPLEVERLQGFPDGYTAIPWRGRPVAADGQRYHAVGNSMAVPVMAWIGKRIKVMNYPSQADVRSALA